MRPTNTEASRRRAVLAGGLSALLIGATSPALAEPTIYLQPEIARQGKYQLEIAEAAVACANATDKDLELHENPLVWILVGGQTIALIGAAVGGARARKKGEELKTTVEKLRQVNETLRIAQKEARRQGRRARQAERKAQTCEITESDDDSGDGEEAEVQKGFRDPLLAARNTLTDGNPQKALAEFAEIQAKAADMGDMKAVRKAVRGCAAAKQRLGDFKGALEALQQSLRLGEEIGETEGDKETLGRIADLYAEINDFDQAGVYYDKYLACTGSDRGL